MMESVLIWKLLGAVTSMLLDKAMPRTDIFWASLTEWMAEMNDNDSEDALIKGVNP